ncbi:MAG TPA: hypothetical protein DEQ50_08210 [Lactobacillus sp.]|nr:hypothetical protein [Lactobacillus sp.]
MRGLYIVGLLPDIDRRKTIENVKNYFEHEFPRLIAQSHISLTFVQSPSFDSIGSGISTRNNQEDKIIGKLSAKEYLKITMKLISNCPHEYMLILKNYYVHNMTNDDLQDLLGYGSTRYNELKNLALLYFADAFTDYYDLHVYIPENEKSDIMPVS